MKHNHSFLNHVLSIFCSLGLVRATTEEASPLIASISLLPLEAQMLNRAFTSHNPEIDVVLQIVRHTISKVEAVGTLTPKQKQSLESGDEATLGLILKQIRSKYAMRGEYYKLDQYTPVNIAPDKVGIPLRLTYLQPELLYLGYEGQQNFKILDPELPEEMCLHLVNPTYIYGLEVGKYYRSRKLPELGGIQFRFNIEDSNLFYTSTLDRRFGMELNLNLVDTALFITSMRYLTSCWHLKLLDQMTGEFAMECGMKLQISESRYHFVPFVSLIGSVTRTILQAELDKLYMGVEDWPSDLLSNMLYREVKVGPHICKVPINSYPNQLYLRFNRHLMGHISIYTQKTESRSLAYTESVECFMREVCGKIDLQQAFADMQEV